MSNDTSPEWEQVLAAAAHLQRILPDAVLVGGSASAVYATRDYLDFVALAEHMGDDAFVAALQPFDRLYPQTSGESALQQLQIQLAQPLPYDLEELTLSEYKNLDPRWHDWRTVSENCVRYAVLVFDRITGLND